MTTTSLNVDVAWILTVYIVSMDVVYTCLMNAIMSREGRKKEASKVKQTNKAKQHSTPKAVTFPRKNELPRVGLEPTTLYTLDMYICVVLIDS